MSSKKQRTLPRYELLYHPGIPGRGEYIRLALEAAGVAYFDVANEKKNGYDDVMKVCSSSSIGDDDGNPPPFCPPALRVPGAGKGGKGALVISQTANILLYLGQEIGLAPDDAADRFFVQEIAMTALDLSNETHDTHHPVALMDFYEIQMEPAKIKATDFRKHRIPKFFSYFERILKGNESEGKGKYLVGKKLSYADTTLWQVIDGLFFAFPKEMDARQAEFPVLFDTFYPKFKEEKGIKEYLSSKRRLPFSMGLFRHYPELDRE